MQRSTKARWAYGFAAVAVLMMSFLFFGTITYSCPDLPDSSSQDCRGQGGTEMVIRTAIVLLGICLAGWLASRALRRTTPRR